MRWQAAWTLGPGGRGSGGVFMVEEGSVHLLGRGGLAGGSPRTPPGSTSELPQRELPATWKSAPWGHSKLSGQAGAPRAIWVAEPGSSSRPFSALPSFLLRTVLLGPCSRPRELPALQPAACRSASEPAGMPAPCLLPRRVVPTLATPTSDCPPPPTHIPVLLEFCRYLVGHSLGSSASLPVPWQTPTRP